MALFKPSGILLNQAIEEGQVTAVIRGMPKEAIFTEPMLLLELTNESSSAIMIVIPQGLVLTSNVSKRADLVTLRTEQVALQPGQDIGIGLFAYSLQYEQSWPDQSTKYQAGELVDNRLLKDVLDHIILFEAQNELASQILVWMVSQKIELKQLERIKGVNIDFSVYRNRVNELRRGPNYLWLWLLSGSLFLIVLVFVVSPLLRRLIRERSKLINKLHHWELYSQGGMAEIWVANHKHQNPASKVVIKFPRAESKLPPKINLYRFETEISIHRKLNHENIVKFLEAGEYRHPRTGEMTPFIIQNFIKGRTIGELLRQDEGLPKALIVEITTKLLDVLAYLHNNQIVHGDLSLKNILVDEQGKIYLIDFGAARYMNSTGNDSLGLPRLGTRPFYAPRELYEQLNAKIDLYSLAVVIYAMYGGQLSKQTTTSDMMDGIDQLTAILPPLKALLIRCLIGEYTNVSELRVSLLRAFDQSSTDIHHDQIESIADPIPAGYREVTFFFHLSGFHTLPTTPPTGPPGLLCTSKLPIWRDVSPLYVQLSSLALEHLGKFCEAAKKAYADEIEKHLALVIIDDLPSANDLHKIFALRDEQGLTIIPLPNELMMQGQIEEREIETLREQIDLYMGRANLYDSRTAVADVLSFFGRQTLMANLQKRLKDGSSLMIFGVRKIGKSSLLIRLREESDWLVAIVNLEGYSDTLDYVYEEALRSWQKALEVKFGDLSESNQSEPLESSISATPAQAFRTKVNHLLDLLARLPSQPGLLLFLDEMDYLLDEAEYRDFASVLRNISENPHSRTRFAMLIAGLSPTLNRSDRIAGGRNPFFSFFAEIPVGPLDLAAAHTMIRTIGSQMGVKYTKDALEMLGAAGGGHPFLTRQLCSQAIRNLERPTTVDSAQAEQAIEAYLGHPRNYLAESLWNLDNDGPPPAEAALLKALATSQPLSEEPLIPAEQALKEQRLAQLALNELRDQSLIRQVKGGWEISIPLYRRWIRRYILNLPDDTHAEER